MSDADPSCRHGDDFAPECSPCRGRRVEAEYQRTISTLEARVKELEGGVRQWVDTSIRVTLEMSAERATLEARIEELTRERDEALKERAAYASVATDLQADRTAARAERDEAVGLLRENPGAWQPVEVPEDDPAFGPVNMWMMCPHCGDGAGDCDALAVCWGAKVRARLAPAPEKETTPSGPYSNT